MVSNKIKKLPNTLIIFNNSSNVMMTSFIIKKKKDLELHAISDPPFLIN